MGDGVRVLFGRIRSIGVGYCAVDAARQGLRGDALVPGQAGRVNRQRGCGACVSSSTGRYGDRR